MPCTRLLLLLALISCTVAVHGDERIRVTRRATLLRATPQPAASTHRLDLTLVLLSGSNWTPANIEPVFQRAADLLAQCGIQTGNAELIEAAVPATHLDFDTPSARDIVRALPLRKPTVYFVADTRQRPAFDAEAIGRGNSRSRPELADTVWITRAARDAGIVLAHELVHVLMDSGQHAEEDGNLMRDDTTPHNTRLDTAQCTRITATAAANGLLRDLRAPK